jgi:hypothetical protein
MNRPNTYMKQLVGLAAWLRAEGDEAAALEVDALAEHLTARHEAVDDQTMPDWTVGPRMDALDVEPAIRCWPEVGCVFEGADGPVLTIDPLDGSDVAIVHMGDVVRWMSSRIDADTSEQATRAAGEAQAEHDAERVAYDATVGGGYAAGEATDAEFEVDEAINEDDGAFARFNAARAASIPDEMSLLDEDEDDVGEDPTDDQLGIELAAEADREGDGWVNPYSREAGRDDVEDSEGPDDIDLTGDADTGAEDDE